MKDFEVLFEDEALLLVNKPANLASSSTQPGSFFEIVQDAYKKPIFLAHRLDKDTSGCLLFVKKASLCGAISLQFEQKKIQKTYVFLSQKPAPKVWTWRESYISKKNTGLWQSLNRGDLNQKAKTGFKLIRETTDNAGEKRFLIEARPKTGKTHQIRLHAKDLGFEIYGDTRYGANPAKRIYLHAWKMVLIHPVTKQPLKVEAPWPQDWSL